MGLFSRKKKPQEKLRLQGFPGHVDTCKCLYLISEKDIPADFELPDVTDSAYQQSLNVSSPASLFNRVPRLSDGKLTFSGAAAVLPYLDIKGKGQSLVPRKAARLGEQNYWIEVGEREVLPHLNRLVQEQLLVPLTDASHQPDTDIINGVVFRLAAVFGIADQYLADKSYFAGNFSLAEIHWMPYLHFCQLAGQHALITAHPNLEKWFKHQQQRTTATNQSTFAVMPDAGQIQNKELRHVA